MLMSPTFKTFFIAISVWRPDPAIPVGVAISAKIRSVGNASGFFEEAGFFGLAWLYAGLPANHTPHVHFACAFHLDGSGGFAVELSADQIVSAARDLDRPALPMGFHAARQVHRVAPEIVDELLAADDASDHRSGIDADAEPKRHAAECPARHGFAHVESELHQSERVVGPLARRPGGDHIAVADRLDLLEAVLFDQVVEDGENLVEEIDQAERRHRRGHWGESDN